MKTLKVLIADDEPDILEVMVKAVKGHGYDVVSAENGQEAWDKIKEDNPDIVLLDLIMPEMHGLTILKRLKENPSPDKWQPVVIISALGELEDVKKGFSLEADHYITKPCTIETVLKAVDIMASQIKQKG
ncbi:MAG: response regulator [Candidatus Aceula meridiana]|nr:response regulator [Candidatus Aceula meridiana]